MELYKRIEDDLKAAMKASDAVKTSTLRMLISAIKTQEIDKKVKRLEEKDVVQIAQRQIKQRKESIEQFRKGNREDLAGKEAKELAILEGYMPKQLSETEILEIVKAVMAETGAAQKSETGKVMKLVMERVQGRADGRVVNQLVIGLLK